MPSEKNIICVNETMPRSSHESPCVSARGQTRVRMTWISSNTQTHGFKWLESFLPQALIHHASKFIMPQQQRNVYSETERRRARTKKQAPIHIRKTAMVKLNHNLLRYPSTTKGFCTLRISRARGNSPPHTEQSHQKEQNNSSYTNKTMREHKDLNKLHRTIASNEFHAKLPLWPRTKRHPAQIISFKNWLSIITLRVAIKKHIMFTNVIMPCSSHESLCVSTLGQTRKNKNIQTRKKLCTRTNIWTSFFEQSH